MESRTTPPTETSSTTAAPTTTTTALSTTTTPAAEVNLTQFAYTGIDAPSSADEKAQIEALIL